MSALLRLLERQGILRGDVNHLQRFALQEVIKREYKERRDLEVGRTRIQMAIAHPEAAKKILSEADKEDDDLNAPEIEEFDPNNPGFSQESIETMMAALEEFGFYVEGVTEDDGSPA